MMPAQFSALRNENESENNPPLSSVSIALPSVPPLGERSLNAVPTPAPAATLTLTEVEKKQLIKAKKKALETVGKKRLIDEANRLERSNESLMPLVVAQKERKLVIDFKDDFKPAFYRGAYVRVDRDYSPGKNRQEGYGYVHKVAGVGGATIVSVQMSKDGGDGCLHHNISVDHLTSSLVDLDGESPRRKRKPVESSTINLPGKKQFTDDRSPLERLINILQDGACKGKKKGWYLKELRVTDKGKTRLSKVEIQQLWTEVQLLECYIKHSQSREPRRKNNRTGKYMKSSATSKALTSTTYLVETTYGRSKSFLWRLRKMLGEMTDQLVLLYP
jgi:hypothetical protein